MMSDPRGAQEDAEDLLLRDWLVGGLWVGLGCRSEDGVDVDVDEGDELRVDRGGGLAKLVEDPVLEGVHSQSQITTLPDGLGTCSCHTSPGSTPPPARPPTLMDTLCLVKARLRSSW